MDAKGLTATSPPKLPKWIFFLQIAIIVLSFGVLIAAAVNIAAFNDWSRYVSTEGPGGFLIFDAIFTWIILGTMMVFERWYNHLYLRIVYVVFLILAAIFWLSAWAWAASVASAFSGAYSGRWQSDDLDRYGDSIAACAALGAFTWVAIVVLTVFYIMSCLRDGGDSVNQTEMGMAPKHEPTADAAPTATAAPATGGFNEQTQDYYGAQPAAQPAVQPEQQQYPYSAQEMPQQQPQMQDTPYPADNTTPYPNQPTQQHP